eukprot:scaffold113977_cov28-Tisochrysis_lutea.AAC.11
MTKPMLKGEELPTSMNCASQVGFLASSAGTIRRAPFSPARYLRLRRGVRHPLRTWNVRHNKWTDSPTMQAEPTSRVGRHHGSSKARLRRMLALIAARDGTTRASVGAVVEGRAWSEGCPPRRRATWSTWWQSERRNGSCIGGSRTPVATARAEGAYEARSRREGMAAAATLIQHGFTKLAQPRPGRLAREQLGRGTLSAMRFGSGSRVGCGRRRVVYRGAHSSGEREQHSFVAKSAKDPLALERCRAKRAAEDGGEPMTVGCVRQVTCLAFHPQETTAESDGEGSPPVARRFGGHRLYHREGRQDAWCDTAQDVRNWRRRAGNRGNLGLRIAQGDAHGHHRRLSGVHIDGLKASSLRPKRASSVTGMHVLSVRRVWEEWRRANLSSENVEMAKRLQVVPVVGRDKREAREECRHQSGDGRLACTEGEPSAT